MTAFFNPMLLEIDSSEYLDIYKEYSDYFSNFNIIFDLLRSLGWIILKGLVALENQLTKVLDIVFDFINFLHSNQIDEFYTKIKPFVFTVLMFGLLYMSYCYIFAHEKPKGVITNIFIFAGVMMILPFFMLQMNHFVQYGKEVLNISQSESGYDLLDPYITDLLYLDSIDFDSETISKGVTNGFDNTNYENIKYLDINEVLDPGDFDLKNEKLFKQEISSNIEDGKDSIGVSDIKKSKFFFKDTTPYYYRYHVNFFIAILYLLALIIVLIFSSFKLIQLIYELASEKILAPFIAAGDLTNGQKIRKALIGILNGYITILCVLFLQKLFLLATTYINTTEWTDNIVLNGLVKVLMILAGALFIIDGPNFFEQIFGIDAGLKSVGQALQSAYYGSQMAGGAMNALKGAADKVGNVAKTPGNMVKGAGKASKKVLGGAAQVAGMVSGMKDTGLFESNNEKVQNEMASTKEQDKSVTGTNQTNNNEDIQSQMKNSDTSSSSSLNPEAKGKNNLAGDNSSNVNQMVNDALNKNNTMTKNNPSSPKENDNLVNWAKDNTKTGQYLSGKYEGGKNFGHAAGNTVNDIKRNADKTVDNMTDNKDMLKG